MIFADNSEMQESILMKSGVKGKATCNCGSCSCNCGSRKTENYDVKRAYE